MVCLSARAGRGRGPSVLSVRRGVQGTDADLGPGIEHPYRPTATGADFRPKPGPAEPPDRPSWVVQSRSGDRAGAVPIGRSPGSLHPPATSRTGRCWPGPARSARVGRRRAPRSPLAPARPSHRRETGSRARPARRPCGRPVGRLRGRPVGRLLVRSPAWSPGWSPAWSVLESSVRSVSRSTNGTRSEATTAVPEAIASIRTMPKLSRATCGAMKRSTEPEQLGAFPVVDLARHPDVAGHRGLGTSDGEPAPSLPGVHSAPSLPGVHSAPSPPGVHSAPSLPGVHSAPSLPGDDQLEIGVRRTDCRNRVEQDVQALARLVQPTQDRRSSDSRPPARTCPGRLAGRDPGVRAARAEVGAPEAVRDHHGVSAQVLDHHPAGGVGDRDAGIDLADRRPQQPAGQLHRPRTRRRGVEGGDHRNLSAATRAQPEIDGVIGSCRCTRSKSPAPEPAAGPGQAQRAEVHPGDRAVVRQRNRGPGAVDLVGAQPVVAQSLPAGRPGARTRTW